MSLGKQLKPTAVGATSVLGLPHPHPTFYLSHAARFSLVAAAWVLHFPHSPSIPRSALSPTGGRDEYVTVGCVFPTLWELKMLTLEKPWLCG